MVAWFGGHGACSDRPASMRAILMADDGGHGQLAMAEHAALIVGLAQKGAHPFQHMLSEPVMRSVGSLQ